MCGSNEEWSRSERLGTVQVREHASTYSSMAAQAVNIRYAVKTHWRTERIMFLSRPNRHIISASYPCQAVPRKNHISGSSFSSTSRFLISLTMVSISWRRFFNFLCARLAFTIASPSSTLPRMLSFSRAQS